MRQGRNTIILFKDIILLRKGIVSISGEGCRSSTIIRIIAMIILIKEAKRKNKYTLSILDKYNFFSFPFFFQSISPTNVNNIISKNEKVIPILKKEVALKCVQDMRGNNTLYFSLLKNRKGMDIKKTI
jgi:hypothetical protein